MWLKSHEWTGSVTLHNSAPSLFAFVDLGWWFPPYFPGMASRGLFCRYVESFLAWRSKVRFSSRTSTGYFFFSFFQGIFRIQTDTRKSTVLDGYLIRARQQPRRIKGEVRTTLLSSVSVERGETDQSTTHQTHLPRPTPTAKGRHPCF